MTDLVQLIRDVWQKANPYVALVWSSICWVMFPQESYLPAAIALAIAMVLDYYSKIRSLSAKNGGYRKAVRVGAISRNVAIEKTKLKIQCYLCLMILAGLATRVAPIAFAGVLAVTAAYGFMFVHETRSVIDNFIDAGVEGLEPYRDFVSRRGTPDESASTAAGTTPIPPQPTNIPATASDSSGNDMQG